MRGAITQAPISYLMRDRLILLPKNEYDEDEYDDFYQQLIVGHPIIQAVYAAVGDENLLITHERSEERRAL